jgi:hypothetical protein
MTAVMILNVALAVLIIAAILSLLSWGIRKDRAMLATLEGRVHSVRARQQPRAPRRQPVRALDARW